MSTVSLFFLLALLANPTTPPTLTCFAFASLTFSLTCVNRTAVNSQKFIYHTTPDLPFKYEESHKIKVHGKLLAKEILITLSLSIHFNFIYFNFKFAVVGETAEN